MKKKLKKSLACLLAALLIFSAVPMSALADEADTPVSVTVETNAEKAAQDTEPDAEPKPEITAAPTATPTAVPTATPTPTSSMPKTGSDNTVVYAAIMILMISAAAMSVIIHRKHRNIK